jgi:zinc D-Ala-D-Ala carboxypeptidase
MKYFTPEEFASPDAPGSGARMNKHFLDLLDQMREEAGIPFHINSGYRTVTYNAALKDATPNSAHTRGMAADIAATTGREKWLIVDAAMKANIKRIGIGKTFVHVDIDGTLPNPSIWLYA